MARRRAEQVSWKSCVLGNPHSLVLQKQNLESITEFCSCNRWATALWSLAGGRGCLWGWMLWQVSIREFDFSSSYFLFFFRCPSMSGSLSPSLFLSVCLSVCFYLSFSVSISLLVNTKHKTLNSRNSDCHLFQSILQFSEKLCATQLAHPDSCKAIKK